ncbi:alpha-amylase [Streptomyces sp. NPDC005931]|uniref:alpha-amylase n=1 Tax=Streptomyces sp. NPDC005931 TaxID=3364737 RepID=UPI0036BF7E1B
MTNLPFTPRSARRLSLAATAAAALSAVLTAAPPAAALTDTTPPECVQYYAGWRYTIVVNGCERNVAVTVEYTDGQDAPCRIIEPGASATFAGYGPQLNYVTGLRTCGPDPAPTSGA